MKAAGACPVEWVAATIFARIWFVGMTRIGLNKTEGRMGVL